jgi:hypothetical protein
MIGALCMLLGAPSGATVGIDPIGIDPIGIGDTSGDRCAKPLPSFAKHICPRFN